MSGFFQVFHITLGVLSVASVMYVNYRLKVYHFFDDDMDDLNQLRFGRATLYFFWMLIQIVKSGFHVFFVISRPSMPIKTTMVTFRTDLPSAHARMILGNSITLTPGTLTIDIDGDLFTVHALDEKSYAGIVSDEMPRKVLGLFEPEERQVIHDVHIQDVKEVAR